MLALLRAGSEPMLSLLDALDRRGRIEASLDVLLDPPENFLPYLSSRPFDNVVRLLVDRGDKERLAKIAALYGWPIAASALLQLKAYDVVLRDIGTWHSWAQNTAITELQRLTGHPVGKPAWPQFREDQDALVRTWAKDLGVTLKG
jgi:hypothetical protein